MMMTTAVSTPTPATPVPTPVLYHETSRISGAKKPSNRKAAPSPFEASTGDAFTTKTKERSSSNASQPSESLRHASSNSGTPSKPKKQVNWPLVGGIVATTTAAVALIAFLAKGGERDLESVVQHAEHSHAPNIGDAECTKPGCDHSNH
jgi:hypothetical protein